MVEIEFLPISAISATASLEGVNLPHHVPGDLNGT